MAGNGDEAVATEAAVPVAPSDAAQKAIIDKLAVFVAKNGAEFEEMTMRRQRHNAKFGFLFGGEHYDYYCARVAAAEAAGENCERAEVRTNWYDLFFLMLFIFNKAIAMHWWENDF